jgi:hypothetical protein
MQVCTVSLVLLLDVHSTSMNVHTKQAFACYSTLFLEA